MNKYFYLLLLIFCFIDAQSQGIMIVDEYQAIRTAEILDLKYGKKNQIFTSIKYLDSKYLTSQLIENFDDLNDYEKTSATYIINQYNYHTPSSIAAKSKIYADSLFYSYEKEAKKQDIIKLRKPILKYFFSNPNHLYTIETDKFSMHVDPIIDITASTSNDGFLFQNTRGARISGYIDQKVYFYSQILENQAIFPKYVIDYVNRNKALPGNGFIKNFKSNIFDSAGGYDYLNAVGYLGIPVSKSISFDIGHGKHFIGDGMRSLLLSDFSNNYFYLKLNTKIWKFQYQNIFAELASLSSRDLKSDVLIGKKYIATHYLSFKPIPNIEVGLFESVVFSRENHFEFQYLNPIIFYRSIEQALGSPDNAMLGINASWDIYKTIKLYGQIAVDEFNIKEFGKGWWGSKQGGQLGFKYYNAFNIEGLDIRCETNYVRPFTYAQSRPLASKPEFSTTSYSHYKQALAHPLGANFKEYIMSINAPITSWLDAELTLIHSQKGYNPENSIDNYGGDIFILTHTEENPPFKEYDNFIGQGLKDKVNYGELKLSACVFPNLFIDLKGLYRNSSLFNQKETIIGTGIRYNISPTNHRF